MSRLSNPKHSAYHLRPNKAVDRMLFAEILKAFHLYKPLQDGTYIGFGGPFLEDFRVMSQLFPGMKMVSLEKDLETYKRQKFNKCSKNIKLLRKDLKDYLSLDYPEKRTYIWTDFTDFSRKRLLQISDIAHRAIPLSLIRVTVKAQSEVLSKLELGERKRRRSLPEDCKQKFLEFSEDFQRRYDIEKAAYDANMFTWENFLDDKYCYLLMHMINTVLDSSCTHPKVFVPLHASRYSDGTIMLSYTGVFCNVEDKNNIVKHFVNAKILSSKGIVAVNDIDVPVLTTKERLKLEPTIPAIRKTGKTSLRSLGYLIEGDGKNAESLRVMKQYEQYFQYYPYFGKLVP